MNLTTHREPDVHTDDLRSEHQRKGAFWAILTTAGSFGVGAWALAAASGATQLTETDVETEFLDGGVTCLAFMLLIPIFLASRHHVLAGLAATAGLVAGQTWAMWICVGRYADSGWSDGLEVLGLILPIFCGICGLVVVVATWLNRRPRFRD